MGLVELRSNSHYFKAHWLKYLHIFIANSFLSAPLYRLSLPHFKNIITHNHKQNSQLSSFAKNIVCLKNAVFPLHNNPPRSFRQQTPNFLYIGHTKTSKGVDVLLEILAILKEDLEFTLTLATSDFGGDMGLTELSAALQLDKQIIYKPEISVQEELLNADAIILPLRTCVGTTLSPNVIIEAISMGTPVICSYFPELEELILDGKNGIFIDPGDIQGSAKTINLLMQNIGSLQEISRHQISFFKQYLSLEDFIENYKTLLIEGPSHE